MSGQFVINGAKLKCPLCSSNGTLKVSHADVQLQDVPMATEGDRSKTNLVFGGVCKKWRKNPPPCASVISPTVWKKVANGLTVDGEHALLERSFIKCATGGKNISISNTAQVDFPTDLPDAEEEQEEMVSSAWTDPLNDPEITLFSQNGNYKPWASTFGHVRNNGNRHHSGLDLFALVGTELFACLDSTVANVYLNVSGYGNVVLLKVDNTEDFINSRNEYVLQYPNQFGNKGEIEQHSGFNTNEDIYLMYAHMQSFSVVAGDKVKSGDIIGLSGVSGVRAGTNAPHLHFEIISSPQVGGGLSNKYNPAFYVNHKLEEEANRAYQEEISQKRYIE